MCEREYTDNKTTSNRGLKSGVWYHAKWKPHFGNSYKEEPVYQRIRYEPVLLTADQAAKFATGELKREDLPPRMKEVIVTAKEPTDHYALLALGLVFDFA